MSVRVLFLCLCLLASFTGTGQNDVKSAQKEMSLYNYSKAAEILLKVEASGKAQNKCEATWLLADCYRMMNDQANAGICYEKAFGMADQCGDASRPAAGDYFNFAQALRSGGEYIRAKKFFLRFDSMVSGQHRGALFATYCDSAISWQKADRVFETGNVKELNSPQSEFGTVFYKCGIVFASDRLSTAMPDRRYGWTGNNYLSLYFSEPADLAAFPGGYKVPSPMTDIPGQAWHDGPATFNADFTEVFINQTLLKPDKGKKEPGKVRTHLLKVVSSVLKDGKWSSAAPFFLNSDEYSVGHPALSADGTTLFFVSDMPGGYGETDIWYCKRDGSGWGKPVNMGPTINTPGKEMFPFIAPNGDLAFASDGLPGFGGLDLFISRNVAGKFGTPANMGWPVNSSCDDFSPAIAENDSSGFFSSNRPGGMGGDDIYRFRKIRHPEEKPVDSTVLIPPILVIKPIPDTLQINKSYRLENIFYNFDKWDIRADAQPSLDKLVAIMKEYPVSVELGSHTDCRGSESYNQELSQKRAESAVNYIISRGISAERIIARGYGKSQLVNKCNCSGVNSCSEAEHQFNRRTEFRITGIKQ